jgi:phosphate starvation-inducible PhoH-like protein
MEEKIRIKSHAQAQALFGPRDENIKDIGKKFKVRLSLRGGDLKISGTAAHIAKARVFITQLLETISRQDDAISSSDLRFAMRDQPHDQPPGEGPFIRQPIDSQVRLSRHTAKTPVGPKTKGQRDYFEAIKKYDIVFGIGPAGTGKTYLAMACAVDALKNAEVRRIILTRPAIEAGESLGYLPGDMFEKISPYLRPLYDALYDMMDAERIEKYLETGIIEVAPLAYMRGRTLNDAFIILDEAQNSTPEQMKMFLTRLGFDSKAVITGDITQSDLPDGKPVGLLQAMDILKDIKGIKFTFFSGSDVVRHELVQEIIKAYEETTR